MLLILTHQCQKWPVSVLQLGEGKLTHQGQHLAPVRYGTQLKQVGAGWYEQVDAVQVYQLHPPHHLQSLSLSLSYAQPHQYHPHHHHHALYQEHEHHHCQKLQALQLVDQATHQEVCDAHHQDLFCQAAK